MRFSTIFTVCLVLVVCALIPAASIFAQAQKSIVSVEVVKSDVDFYEKTTAMTSTTFLSGSLPINNKLTSFGELPFVHFNIDEKGYPYDSQNRLGNPYVGLVYHEANVNTQLGMRLPLVSDIENSSDSYALNYGQYANYINRMGAFLHKRFPVYASVEYIDQEFEDIDIQVYNGLTALFAQSDAYDHELFWNYNIAAGFSKDKFAFMIGWGGFMLLTDDDLSFTKRNLNQAEIGVQYDFGDVRPGVSLRVPVDKDYSDMIDFAIGFKVDVVL